MTETEPLSKIVTDIEATFARYRWGLAKLGDGVFATGIEGDNGVHDLFIEVTEHWVTLRVAEFVPMPDEGWGPCALTLMARANDEMTMAKMGLDEDDAAFLAVELPTEGFVQSHITDALEVISHYANLYVMHLFQATRVDALNAAASA